MVELLTIGVAPGAFSAAAGAQISPPRVNQECHARPRLRSSYRLAYITIWFMRSRYLPEITHGCTGKCVFQTTFFSVFTRCEDRQGLMEMD